MTGGLEAVDRRVMVVVFWGWGSKVLLVSCGVHYSHNMKNWTEQTANYFMILTIDLVCI